MIETESTEAKVAIEHEQPAESAVSWADSLHSVLGHLRKYSSASVVDAALVVLNSAPTDKLTNLRQFPWLLMLIAKWALQENTPLRIGPKLPPEHFDELRNILWIGGGAAHLERKVRQGEINVMLMMRQILHCQMPFQTEEIWGLFRSSGLIDRLPKDHACKRQYLEVIGMEPLVFVMLGSVLLHAAKSSEHGSLDMTLMDMLRPTYDKEINAFFALLAPSLPDLRLKIRKLPPAKGTRSRELYEFPFFKRYPLIRRRNGRIDMWHLSVVHRCMDELVHLALAQFGERYTKPFSRVFEDYVVELAITTGHEMTNEEGYWNRYGRQQKAVDAILTSGVDRVLIEAKMGLFHEDVLLQETMKGVRDQTPHLIRALKQGYAVSHQLAAERPEGETDVEGTHYLIVVTSRDLLIGSGLMLAEICGAGSTAPDEGCSQQRLALNHIFFLPILEYERLMEAVATGVVDLFDVLRGAAAACADLSGSRYHFHDYYRARINKFPMPRLINSVREAALAQMASAVDFSMPA